ncbi:UDP-glycosyltransferase UGT5-like [Uranotaenia lowii]|uniref:UDP-glycosyltransferase UGT5-like n=1 Tax=Uranotaenia lowii TaxID=190385 RepID=UPI00247A2BCA|nr:UDP-glycosyltransferase UGT5-like [Uranotaenia lowii]
MGTSNLVIVLLIALISCLSVTSGSSILFLAPFNGPSHWLMLKQIIRELASRGHEITCITGIKFGEKLPNYNEVFIDPPYPMWDKFPLAAIYNTKGYTSDFNNLFLYWRLGLDNSQYGLESENVQRFLNRDDLHFDLVVSEQFFQESWLMFAHKYNAPIVTISTYGYSDFFDRAMGLLTPWSSVPHMLLDYDDGMNFSQRIYNCIISSLDYIIREFDYLPKQNALAKQYFADLERQRGPLPSVQALQKNISLILVNSHPMLAKPRPSITGLVNVAGVHIPPPKSLPSELQRFMDEAKHGVIYFSLGAYMQSSEMPLEKRNTILKVFSKLKQRVIWKFESEKIGTIPSNILIQKWAPQSDVLAHKNVILFISHGGQFGTFEAMHHGVPTLFMPFFGDQHRNANRAIRSGFAMKHLFQDITEESFGALIEEMVDNKKYLETARAISTLFRDRQNHPMNETMFWIEYVLRHRGAAHLKSKAVNLSIAQYLLLDIIGALVFGLLVTIFIMKSCCCKKGRAKKLKNQ